MKLSTLFEILLVVGVVFFIFAMMVNEANDTYSANLTLTGSSYANGSYSSDYDFATQINATIAPVQGALSDITDTDKGWFSKIVSGITAIPWAVITLPVAIFQSIKIGSTMITGFLALFGIPAYIILVVLIMVVVWAVVKLVELFHRWYV